MKKRFAVVILFFLVFLFVLLTNDEILRSMQLPIMGLSADLDVSCYEKLSTKDSFPNFNTSKGRHTQFFFKGVTQVLECFCCERRIIHCAE